MRMRREVTSDRFLIQIQLLHPTRAIILTPFRGMVHGFQQFQMDINTDVIGAYLVSAFGTTLCVASISKFINHPHRSAYITKNLFKGVVLISMCACMAFPVYSMLTSKWDPTISKSLRISGVIYASTDFAGLVVIPALPKSTIAHHIIVMIVAGGNCVFDYSKTPTGQCIIMTCFTSCAAGLANVYLGWRFMGTNTHLLRWATYMYSAAVGTNIIFHALTLSVT